MKMSRVPHQWFVLLTLFFISNSPGLTSSSRIESSLENQRTTATVPFVNITATYSSQPHSPSYVPAVTTVQPLSLTTSSLSSSFTPQSRNSSITTAVEISHSRTFSSAAGSVNVSTTSSPDLTHISKETSIKPSISSTQQSRVSSSTVNSFQSKF